MLTTKFHQIFEDYKHACNYFNWMRKINEADKMKEKDNSKTKNTIMTQPHILHGPEMCL